MKLFGKFLAVSVLAVAFTLSLAGQASAADSPDLGAAGSFAVLAGTEVTNVPTSDITGNVGLSPAAGSNYTGLTAAQVTGTIYAVDATGPAGSVVNPVGLTTAKNDLTAAYDDLDAGNNADANCINPLTMGAGSAADGSDLSGLSLVPGLYCSAGSFILTDGVVGVDLVLTGAGPWVFKTVSGLTISSGSSVSVPTAADVCDVWWRVGSSATIGTNASFIGSILALTSISMSTGATLDGRVLARNGAVTLDQNTITNAPCSAGATLHATLRVVKDVENDDGDDQHADDFTLYVELSGTNVAGSPALGVASPGRTYLLAPGTYVVSEDEDSAYNQSFSGDCDSDGNVTLVAGDDKTCTITNDDKADDDEEDDDDDDDDETTAPRLPNTGIAPQEFNFLWNIILNLF